MKAVIQRVKKCRVKVGDKTISKIDQGMLVLLAVRNKDNEKACVELADKIINLRIFNDKNNKMNLSLRQIKGQVLVVSQFTLYADTRKGCRPSFMESAKPEQALPLYEKFVSHAKQLGLKVQTGEFGAMMDVEIVNDGPVTIILEN